MLPLQSNSKGSATQIVHCTIHLWKINNWDITDSYLTSSRKTTRGYVCLDYKQLVRVTTDKQKVKVQTKEDKKRSR